MGDPVLKQIPRQLKIDARLRRDIVSCTKSRNEYIVARGHATCLLDAEQP